MRALCSQLIGFREYLAGEGRRYRVMVGKEAISKDDLQLMAGESQAFTFIPVIGGGKGGVLQTVVGAALVVGSFFVPGPWSVPMMNFGIALTLGGVAQMLTKPPSVAGGAASETKNNPSYIFNGGVNTTAQGQCVPVGYGRLRVGSAVISAGIYSSDIPV